MAGANGAVSGVDMVDAFGNTIRFDGDDSRGVEPAIGDIWAIAGPSGPTPVLVTGHIDGRPTVFPVTTRRSGGRAITAAGSANPLCAWPEFEFKLRPGAAIRRVGVLDRRGTLMALAGASALTPVVDRTDPTAAEAAEDAVFEHVMAVGRMP